MGTTLEFTLEFNSKTVDSKGLLFFVRNGTKIRWISSISWNSELTFWLAASNALSACPTTTIEPEPLWLRSSSRPCTVFHVAGLRTYLRCRLIGIQDAASARLVDAACHCPMETENVICLKMKISKSTCLQDWRAHFDSKIPSRAWL